MEKITIWLVNGVVPAATILVLYTGKRSISWHLILVAATIYAVALLVFGETWSSGGSRLTLVDQNPIWAARAILVGALVGVLGPFPLWAKVATVPVLVLASLLTQSLGPLVGLGAGVMAGAVTALVLSSQRQGRPSSGWTVLVISMGFAAVVLLSGLLDPLIGPLVNDPNVTSRTDYIDASLPLFFGAPLYGTGMGGFLASGLDSYLHNFVLEVAVELGLLGIIGLGAWIVLALVGASRSPLVMGLVVGTFAFTLFSGSIASQAEFWMLSAVGVALAPAVLARRRGSDRGAVPAEAGPRLPPSNVGAAGRSGEATRPLGSG
jgi:hypothetical protein